MSDDQLVELLNQLEAIRKKYADTVDVEDLKAIDDCISECKKAIHVKPAKVKLTELLQTAVNLIAVFDWISKFFQ